MRKEDGSKNPFSVYQVPEGSILVLSGIEIEEGYGMDWIMGVIEKTVGHRKFCIIHSPDPDNGAPIEVWGPDTDLEARIKELLTPSND